MLESYLECVASRWRNESRLWPTKDAILVKLRDPSYFKSQNSYNAAAYLSKGSRKDSVNNRRETFDQITGHMKLTPSCCDQSRLCMESGIECCLYGIALLAILLLPASSARVQSN